MTTDKFTRHVARSAGWSVVLSVLTAAVGASMIVYSLVTAAGSTVVFGSALIIAAVAQLLFAVTCESPGHLVVTILLGTIYGVSGLLVIAFPAAGVARLSGVLGMMLIGEGVLELVTAIALPQVSGRGWLVFSAIASFLLGVLIVAEWPDSAVSAIGTLAGVGILINGICRAVISTIVRRQGGGGG